MLSVNYLYKAEIVNVVDGDTVDAAIDLGFRIISTHRLRLARIDCPELSDPDPAVRVRANAARDFVKVNMAASGKATVIKTTKSDLYGRYLAEIYYISADGSQRNLSDALLEAGLAVIYK